MHAPNGLARAALRFRPSAFAGTFVALLMAAMIVSACGLLLATGITASVPPQRYAAAPVVAAADQSLHYTIGSGEDRDEESLPLPDRARLDDSLVAKAASAPGAATAIADLALQVRTAENGPVTAHNWASTTFTGTKPSSGTAPHPGEVVTTTGPVGERIVLDTPGGRREFRISGTAGAPGGNDIWLNDADARALSGHPGKVDAIAVLPRPGTSTATLAAQVKQALGGRAQVRTGDDRSTVEDSGIAQAKEVLTGLGGSFGGVAAMVAMFTAAGTVALSVGQRRREYALLRAIGATPRQIRRTIATEALLVAPLAGALGCLPGVALATWWFGQLRDKGAIPPTVDLAVTPLPLLVAVAATVLTALCAGAAAARRPSKIKPGQALAESAAERLRPGWIRTVLGAGALAGGCACAGLAASESGEDAANAALGVVMLFMVAVALLGPLLARACAAVLGLPLRAAGAAGSLAAANTRTNARRLASAITPIVLAMAFSSVLVFLHTSEERAIEDQQRAGITANHVVTDPAGLPSDAVARAAATPGVETAVGLTRTSVLVPNGGSGSTPHEASAQGVTGTGADLAEVQDPGVRAGTLTALGPGAAAIDASLAAAAHVRPGDRLPLLLPDGTRAAPKVVATYDRGLGLAQVTLSQADLSAHLTAPGPTVLLTRASPAAAAGLAALGHVTDAAGYATAQSTDREVNAWANAVMAAVLGGFAAVAAVNTLVMTVLDRRRELGTLRLIGTTRRQVLGMIRWEALLVVAAGVVIGSAIALVTLVPMANGLTGRAPYVPPLLYGSFAGGVLILALAATSLPARAALR
ncbi:ABC transporter permease [Streptomyces xanthochromogenes]|uniref:ABC transporter permease n=1 Tax=Streptomyces xanthochromogenes TaxID=67384 RepID=UPI00167784A9|nr:ABC transporter permease [Streptomyces xanthochromogenes]GHB69775.1 ABC transporter permease [Streptomyces xanthochromogenes]